MKTMRITESNGKTNDYLYNDQLPNDYLTEFLLKILNTYPMDVSVDWIN